MNHKEMLNSGKSFMSKCVRVWHILKKPTSYEFWTVAKVSAIGILVVGAFGFIISIFVKLFAR